jgi:hypothetical protein
MAAPMRIALSLQTNFSLRFTYWASMPAVTWGSLATTLGINLAICAVVIVFGVLRKTIVQKKVYAPGTSVYPSGTNRIRCQFCLPRQWQPLNAAFGRWGVRLRAGMDALVHPPAARCASQQLCWSGLRCLRKV